MRVRGTGAGRAPPAEPAVDQAPERARAAVGRFKRELKGALTAALAEGGPIHALTVCQREAPRLAAAASGPGLAIGRATLRPRNPDNLAVGWKLDAYHALERAADRATATYTVELPSGVLACAEPLVRRTIVLVTDDRAKDCAGGP